MEMAVKMVSFLSHSLPLFFLFSSSFVLPFCSSYRLASLFAELETVSLQNLKNASSLKSKTAELGCLAIHSAARMRSLLVVDRRPGMSWPFMFARCPTVVIPHSIRRACVIGPISIWWRRDNSREETGDKGQVVSFQKLCAPRSLLSSTLTSLQMWASSSSMLVVCGDSW